MVMQYKLYLRLLHSEMGSESSIICLSQHSVSKVLLKCSLIDPLCYKSTIGFDGHGRL